MAKIFESIWFKCISVLLIIAVIAGGLLAILNDVLYVSPNERTSRAITKIYGEAREVSDEDIIIDGDSENIEKQGVIEYDFGKITKIYKVGEDLLFQTTGFNGYKNGTITLWVKVVTLNEARSIDKVLLQSNEKQTLMSKFTNAYLDNFKLTDITGAYQSGNLFATVGENANPNTGATYSATACCNAVNCVIKYLGEL